MKHDSTKNWFSNFIPFAKPMLYNGVAYRTPEHFFQAMKTKVPEMRVFIASRPTPSKAKGAGRNCSLRRDWETIKDSVMEFAQRYRFASELQMYKNLMSSEGTIVEWNTWHDRTWGKCICEKCKGQGDNRLGRILMKLRDEYKGV